MSKAGRMMIALPLLAVLGTLSLASPAAAQETALARQPLVRFTTSEGVFVVRLERDRAPLSVRNFVSYVTSGFYAGTVFHRVIDGFMAQTGGFDSELRLKDPNPPIANESGNGLSNKRGTLAMARTGDPHSATSQFFINLVDNARLDPSARGWGYTVFGQVVEGMEVIDQIAQIPTGAAGRFRSDVPKTTVLIEKAELITTLAK